MSQENYNEKPSAFKTLVQLTGAFCSVAICEAPQRGYEQFGQTYDYLKTAASTQLQKLKPPSPGKPAGA